MRAIRLSELHLALSNFLHASHGCVSANNVTNLTLRNVTIARTATHGVRGVNVTNFTIDDSLVLNAGDQQVTVPVVMLVTAEEPIVETDFSAAYWEAAEGRAALAPMERTAKLAPEYPEVLYDLSVIRLANGNTLVMGSVIEPWEGFVAEYNPTGIPLRFNHSRND